MSALRKARETIKRGYSPLYRSGATCPGCSASQWHVGRFSAECAFCGTALPIDTRPAPAAIETGPRTSKAWSRA